MNPGLAFGIICTYLTAGLLFATVMMLTGKITRIEDNRPWPLSLIPVRVFAWMVIVLLWPVAVFKWTSIEP